MLSYKDFSKIFLRVLIICCVIFLLYNILKINYRLPEVVKNYSGFEVIMKNNPGLINVKAGEYTIEISTEYFKNFLKGTRIIINEVKNITGR